MNVFVKKSLIVIDSVCPEKLLQLTDSIMFILFDEVLPIISWQLKTNDLFAKKL